jgi:hypothetical protein
LLDGAGIIANEWLFEPVIAVMMVGEYGKSDFGWFLIDLIMFQF